MSTSTLIGRKRTFSESICDDSKTLLEEKEDSDNDITMNTQQIKQEIKEESCFNPVYLKYYYDRLFPYKDIFDWLSYFNDPENTNPTIDSKIWQNREFSFTLENDIYIRFKSYKNFEEFKLDVKKKVPYKIDIGAIYSCQPNLKHSISGDKFIPEEKELVFDIDISDYDDVRTCCSNANICNKCWPLMSCAIRVLDLSLREDFGFNHLFWVYSGRRGIHCWVADKISRKFGTIERSHLLEYLKVYNGNSNNNIKCDLSKTSHAHSSLRRAYGICCKYFITCTLKEQKLLSDEESIINFCNMIRNNNLKNILKDKLILDMESDYENYELKFKLIDNTFIDFKENLKSFKDKKKIGENLYEIIFSYTYPRLDVEVSRHMNHLLKSPFVIHPKTGKICSIIDPNKSDLFDVNKVPTLDLLFNQLNKIDKNTKAPWKYTDMKNIIFTFRNTFLNELKQSCN